MGLAEVAVREDDLAEARSRVDEAAAYIEERGMKDLTPALRLTSAQVARAEGDAAAALETLEELVGTLEEFGMRRTLFDAMAEQADTLDALDRRMDAAAVRGAALEVANAIGADMKNDDLREAFHAGVTARLGL